MAERLAIAAATFGVAAGLSALFVWLAIPLSRRFGLVDHPAPRRAHPGTMPRGGGIPMVLAFVAAVGLTFWLGVERYSEEIHRVILLLMAAGLLGLVMVYDDAIGMSPGIKLLCQTCAALIVVLPRFEGSGRGIVIETFNAPVGDGVVALPLGVGVVVTVLWIVGMINTVNLLDGLDGLAGSVTLVASIILFVHTFLHPQFTISLLAAALGGAVTGFLLFNWHPARIIMGDAGASFLGLSLAVISIIGGAKIATALLALGLPILDVVWLILYRGVHRRSPFVADRSHLHHRLSDAGLHPPDVVAYVAGLSLVFGLAALLLPTREWKAVAIGLLAMILVVTVAVLARRERRLARDRPTVT
ncbi:MAG: MraY family glycosyltransferase [Thermomicrobiales bacterium]